MVPYNLIADAMWERFPTENGIGFQKVHGNLWEDILEFIICCSFIKLKNLLKLGQQTLCSISQSFVSTLNPSGMLVMIGITGYHDDQHHHNKL